MRISDWSSDVCSSDLETAQQTRRCQSDATLGLDEQAEVVGNQVVAAPVRRAGADHSTDEHALAFGAGKESLVVRQAPVYRADERRVGQVCVNTCRDRLSLAYSQKKTKTK